MPLNVFQEIVAARYPSDHDRETVVEIWDRFERREIDFGAMCNEFGDSLLGFLLVELSAQEGAESFEDASSRLRRALDEMRDVLDALEYVGDDPARILEIVKHHTSLERAALLQQAEALVAPDAAAAEGDGS